MTRRQEYNRCVIFSLLSSAPAADLAHTPLFTAGVALRVTHTKMTMVMMLHDARYRLSSPDVLH